MKIGELKDGMTADLCGKIVILDGPKPTTTKFGEQQRSWVVVQDASGKIGGSLWGKNAERVAQGDTLEMFDVLIESYKGELQFKTHKGVKIRITKPPEQQKITKPQPIESEVLPEKTISKPVPQKYESKEDEVLHSKIRNLRVALERAENELDEIEKISGYIR